MTSNHSGAYRDFGIAAGSILLSASAWFWYRHRELPWHPLEAALFFMVLAISPCSSLLMPLQRVWKRADSIARRGLATCALGLVYFGVLFPLGLVRRLRRQGARPSYWVRRTSPTDFRALF